MNDPKVFSRAQAKKMGDMYEHTPVHNMLSSSSAVDLARQYLPENVGSTAAGRWIADLLPGADPVEASDRARSFNKGVRDIPLFGYSKGQIGEFDTLRSEDPELRRYSYRRGEVPSPDGMSTVKVGDSFRAAAAQNAGVLASDVATDGLRNIWWFLNAPQAISSIAMLHGMHKAGESFDQGRPIIKNRRLRMAATVPAWIGMSAAVGNFGRQAGYKAAVPSEADPRNAADPLSEAANRYLLGRTGRLLPYDEFVKERPDVSKGEYNAYKAYLFGNPSPIKATADGIHGPEVTFMGKSIPVATGVLPAIAAVVGGRRGLTKAGRRLNELIPRDTVIDGVAAKTKPISSFEHAKRLHGDWAELKKDNAEGVDAAYLAYRKAQDKNETEALKQVLLGSSKYMSGTALAGMGLESIRRSLKGEAPQE